MTTNADGGAAFRRALLTLPGERQSVDYKAAVRFDSNTDFGLKLIRHVIGMANTGGGWIVIGYQDEVLQPDPALSPEIAATYDTTMLTQAVDRCTDGNQPIRLAVFMETHPQSQTIYPVVEVESFERMPFVCRSTISAVDSSNEILRTGRVYIRRPGGATSEVQTLADWEELIRQCVSQRRDEFLTEFADLYRRMSAGNATPPKDVRAALEDWAVEKRNSLVASGAVTPGAGYLESAQMLLESPAIGWNLHDLRTAANSTKRHYQDLFSPQKDGIEIHINGFSGLATEYWHLSRHGQCYTFESFREDHGTPSFFSSTGHPSKSLWVDLAVHRIGDILLDSVAQYKALNIPPNAPYVISMIHAGLKGRTVYASSPRYQYYIANRHTSLEDLHECQREVTQDIVNSQLVELTHSIASELFALFNFASVSKELVAHLLQELQRWRPY